MSKPRFTPDDRERIRSALIERASADPRISAAALLGSSATGLEDAWSDIDLGLGIDAGADTDAAVADWTEHMYADHGAVHQVDIVAAGALYRVFLLASTLQVDLSFWPSGSLQAHGERFRLLFGTVDEQCFVTVTEPWPATPLTPEHLAGMAWLYLIHARSSIARGRDLQADHFLDGAREQILALACAHHGLPTNDARGNDDLPDHVKEEANRLARRTSGRRAAMEDLDALVAMLQARLREADGAVTERLKATLDQL